MATSLVDHLFGPDRHDPLKLDARLAELEPHLAEYQAVKSGHVVGDA